MVDKEIRISQELISKSLDDAIWKCGQRLMLTKSVKETFNNFHDNYCDNTTKIEHAIITDSEGEIVWEGSGDENSVYTPSPDELDELYKEYGALYLSHNHPRVVNNFGFDEVIAPVAECLSAQDIISISFSSISSPYTRDENGKLVPLIKSISCESYNGSRMTFTVGDDFKATTMNEGEIYILANKLEKYYSKYEDSFYDAYYQVQNDYLATLDKGVRPTDNFKSEKDYLKFLDRETFKRIGVFEKNDEFKDIQRRFRDLDCKLTYTFPRQYHRGL